MKKKENKKNATVAYVDRLLDDGQGSKRINPQYS